MEVEKVQSKHQNFLLFKSISVSLYFIPMIHLSTFWGTVQETFYKLIAFKKLKYWEISKNLNVKLC